MSERIYILVGPTAVGKSEIALHLAEKLDAWIISADSRQVYIGMDIGTAKPSDIERARVRHFLIDLIEPDKTYSAAEFVDASNNVISQAKQKKKNILIVGGTGLYVRALVEGFDLADTPRVEKIRDELLDKLENEGLESLADELHELDPEGASELDLNNPHRVIRALEIVKSTGKSLKEAKGRKKADDYDFTVVGLSRDRDYLNERIRQRTISMIHSGWLNEVRDLVNLNYPENSPAMSGIGYAELREHLKGNLTLEMAIEKIIIRTRQYAKRQMTWFRADDYIHWLELKVEDEPAKVADKIYNMFCVHN